MQSRRSQEKKARENAGDEYGVSIYEYGVRVLSALDEEIQLICDRLIG